MIQGVCGDLSQGKTLTLAEIGANVLRTIPEATIYSNFWLAYPHVRIRSMADFAKMENGVLLADELWYWLDSYRSQERSAQAIVQLLLSSAKKGISVCWSAQDSRQIHARIYRVTSEFLLPKLWPARDKEGRIIMNSDGRTPRPGTAQVFLADAFRRPFAYYTFECEKVFPLYHTKEVIQPLEGLEKFRAAKALKDHRNLQKANELGLDLTKDY